jgi:FixJ family two-component response regulator
LFLPAQFSRANCKCASSIELTASFDVREPGAQVFVVEDDAAMRAAIDSLLRSAGHSVRSFGSAQEFLQRTPSEGPACLVLDVQLPGISGLELQRELVQREPCLPIVFIAGAGDIPMSVRAMKAGAVEFLPKPFRSEALLEAVNEALETARNRLMVRAELASLQERLASLTARERQVAALVVAGFPNKVIAAKLAISEVTVKIHRGQAMQKLQAKSVPALVRMAVRLGIGPDLEAAL